MPGRCSCCAAKVNDGSARAWGGATRDTHTVHSPARRPHCVCLCEYGVLVLASLVVRMCVVYYLNYDTKLTVLMVLLPCKYTGCGPLGDPGQII